LYVAQSKWPIGQGGDFGDGNKYGVMQLSAQADEPMEDDWDCSLLGRGGPKNK
jgi:hypothetical protein